MTAMPEAASRKEEFIEAFALQAKSCEVLGSALNAHLLRLCRKDIEQDGITATILNGWEGPALEGLVATRFIGGPHYLVITDQAPELAKHYPSVGGRFDEATFSQDLFNVLEENKNFMRAFIQSPPQTNEVRRTGILLGGFLEVARSTGLPFRCLEVGASAGLNLIWDQFSYENNCGTWGNSTCPVTIDTEWQNPEKAPSLLTKISVVSCAGCDISPIDLTTDAARIRMNAYVWTDHPERFERLKAAMKLALDNKLTVEQADAADWAADKLAKLPEGQVTVLYHSLAANYFSDDTRTKFEAAIHEAGTRATEANPLAWLRFEHVTLREYPYLLLTQWPGGEERILAQGHPHGEYANWR